MFLHLSVILFTGWGVHDRGCAWQGVCMAGGVHGRGSINGMGGMHGRGHVWQVGKCGRGCVHVWQERRPLLRMVRILLECILVILVTALYYITVRYLTLLFFN